MADIFGRTALQAAAGNGHIRVVTLLVARKAKINARPAAQSGRTALQAASGGGHIAVAKFLLERKASINADGGYYNGQNALQAATYSGHLNMVEFLVANGAVAPDNRGRSQLPPTRIGRVKNTVRNLCESFEISLDNQLYSIWTALVKMYRSTAFKVILLSFLILILFGCLIGIPVYSVLIKKR